MPVPNHGPDCQTLLWPTHCQHCGDEVFFFSCTCGSRVFFDLPHPPWNPHETRCIPYLVDYLRNIERKSAKSIHLLVAEYSNRTGIPVPPTVKQQLERLVRLESPSPTILEISPADPQRAIAGRVMSADRINVFRRFDYAANSTGKALLGRLAAQAHVSVVVRENPDPETGFTCQFTCYVPFPEWEASRLRLGDTVLLTIRKHKLPGKSAIWLVIELERP